MTNAGFGRNSSDTLQPEEQHVSNLVSGTPRGSDRSQKTRARLQLPQEELLRIQTSAGGQGGRDKSETDRMNQINGTWPFTGLGGWKEASSR